MAVRRIGKRTAYNAGMVLFGAALLAAYLFAHRDVTVLFVLMALAGVGLATNYVMPWSIIPDVVDYDELENGQRREGVFYGMWTFLQKLGWGLPARSAAPCCSGPATSPTRPRPPLPCTASGCSSAPSPRCSSSPASSCSPATP